MSRNHRVLRLWTRAAAGGPMLPADSLDVVAARGVVGDHTFGRLPHGTGVFRDD